MARLLGSFAPRALLQTLSFKPEGPSLILMRSRGGPRRSDLSKGRGGQHNGIETKSIEDKTVVNTNSSSRIQKESNPTSITNGQVKDHSITNTSAY